MADIIRIQDLKAEEIAAILASKGRRLSKDQEAAVRDCVSEISNIKRAYDTLDTLGKLNEAA
ncbi:MAG: hypothetical protein H8E44_11275 [Planctomycetes bacterium]|nr:hypothetical protein [Planctomycetota bacterium]MBL7039849.1 hypothetical protein [Pirellulaceae bacterium]